MSAALNVVPVSESKKAVVSADHNMDLWNRVCKTNPANTRQVSKGKRHFTSICSQSQIMAATEQFGPYGSTWGIKNIVRDFETMQAYEIAMFTCVFYYPGGEFEISTTLPIWISKQKGIIDNDICKKSETDLLTKALSKIGFNADVFMGRYDDNRYIAEMEAEFNKPQTITKDQAHQILAFLDAKKIPAADMLRAWNLQSLREIHATNFQPAMDWVEQAPDNSQQHEINERQQLANQVVERHENQQREDGQRRQQRRQEQYQQQEQQAQNDWDNMTDGQRANHYYMAQTGQRIKHTRMEDGPAPSAVQYLDPEQCKLLRHELSRLGIHEGHLCRAAGKESLGQIESHQFDRCVNWLKKKAEQIQKRNPHN